MTKATVSIVMELDFDRVVGDERQQIKAEIAELLGCQVADLGNVRFSRGCLKLEFEVDEELAEIFVDLVKKAGAGGEVSDELAAIRRFLDSREVASCNLVRKSRLSLPREKQSVAGETRDLPGDRQGQEIVLVHGWSGKPESFGILPDALKKRFGRDPYLYAYPTGPFGSSPALSFIARNLRNSILTHTSSDRVALVAHSMGGVIVRRMLANELIGSDSVLDRIKLVVFAASPKNGAGLASLGKLVDSLSQDQLRDLSPDSGFMVDLNDHWREWVKRKVPDPCRLAAIYGLEDRMVTNANAADYDGEAVPLLDKDHRSLVKPLSDSDEIVLTLSRFLVDAGFAAVPPAG